MTAFTDLPEDVVYHFLCSLPDFAALSRVFDLSKKHIYNVFQSNRGGVLFHVASNVAGPCLPNVFRVVGHIVDRPVDALPSKDEVVNTLRSMNGLECHVLEHVCYFIAKLEALFSQM